MSWEVIERNWEPLKSKVMAEWDNLSADRINEIAGRRDQLVQRIQEAYGISKEEAGRQIEAFEEANKDYRPPAISSRPSVIVASSGALRTKP